LKRFKPEGSFAKLGHIEVTADPDLNGACDPPGPECN
jgi:hypothetical protein